MTLKKKKYTVSEVNFDIASEGNVVTFFVFQVPESVCAVDFVATVNPRSEHRISILTKPFSVIENINYSIHLEEDSVKPSVEAYVNHEKNIIRYRLAFPYWMRDTHKSFSIGILNFSCLSNMIYLEADLLSSGKILSDDVIVIG